MRVFSPTLTRRVMGPIVLCLAATAWLMHDRAEKVLEVALLDQVKQHANIFMLGIESQLLKLEDPLDPVQMQSLIDETLMSRHVHELGFAIYEMYFFDAEGRILAHSRKGTNMRKEMEPHYLAIFQRGESYMGDEVEYVTDPATGSHIPKIDIIVPLHYQGGIAAALEVEINLNETLNTIKQLDDQYEREIIYIVVSSALLVLALVWWIVQRWMFAPIQSIATVTRKISEGSLDARVDNESRDELGQLSQSVNKMASSIERLFTEQEEAHMQMLQSLTRALEAKDTYTVRHSARVAHYSVKLGKRLGLSEQQLYLLRQGALMHDLGKIGISEVILNKPDRLNDYEYELMRKHPAMTAAIMRPLKRFKEFAEIAAWHHERWDGRGYPDGLSGEQIPLLARIVSIADTWDAITGDRIYRQGLPTDEALLLLEQEQNVGQWDPKLVQIFIQMIKDMQDTRHEVEEDMFGEGG